MWRQATSLPESLFQFFDPALKARHVAPQFLQAALQHLTLHFLVSQEILNTAKPLEDRVILVLKPLQAPVELIEMAEDVAELFIMLGELRLDRIEALVNSVEAPVDALKPPVDRLEALVDPFKPPVDRIEAAVDLLKPPAQELDELLVLVIGH